MQVKTHDYCTGVLWTGQMHHPKCLSIPSRKSNENVVFTHNKSLLEVTLCALSCLVVDATQSLALSPLVLKTVCSSCVFTLRWFPVTVAVVLRVLQYKEYCVYVCVSA